MITLNLMPIEGETLADLQRRGLSPTPQSFLYAACDGDKLLGRCLYTLDKEGEMFVEFLETDPPLDVWMMDGLVRASVNQAFSQGVWICRFAPEIDRPFLKRFYFDENETNFTIEIHDLLTNHKNCGH